MKRLLFCMLVFLVPSNLFSFDFELDGIYYNIKNDSEVEVTYGSSRDGVKVYPSIVAIPSKVTWKGTEYKVTTIGQKSFSNCKTLEYIYIPSSISVIGSYAFERCFYLTTISIPKGVVEIGKRAFSTCSHLDSIYISNTVKTIGECAFEWCDNLTSVTIPNSVNKIGNSIFYYCIYEA